MTALPLSIRLLVIDDDDVDRERVLRMLARTPLSVDAKQADSSASALQLLREHVFDCIMLDNQLGDGSGAELLPTIQRESRRPCPVIMITGAGNESLAVRALQHGAADYLTKYQLNADLLARAIRRAMDHQRLNDELEELHQRLEQRVEEQAAAIRQSERDLRAILDHTPTVIGYWLSDLRARFGNRAFRRWLGVDPDTLPGRSLGDVIGPARQARVQHHIDGVLRGENQSFELSDLAPDGLTRRHAQISFHADVDDDGHTRGFYSTLNDVTDIKQSQARSEELALFAETLFEHSPVGLAVFDERLRCVKCNRALGQLMGAPERDLLDLELDRLSPDDLLPLKMTALSTLADGLPRHLDLDVVTAFGAPLHAACAWARVERDGHGQLLLAVQDSTEQRRAHDALVQARNAAENATRSKSSFLANMSHEIRTPMNAIIGLTRLALDDGLPAQTRDFIDKAHAAALALMGLLDDVLDYSKIEAGQLRLEQVPLEIEQVLQRVVDLFAARIEQKGLVLVVEIAPGVPRWVRGDPLRLGQVLNNLVGNAVKFTEQGRIVVSVRPADEPAPDQAMLRFSVRDSGIGIAPEHQEALFEAFSQADSSITRRFGGTGLGLSICRRMVAQMHGSIGVCSAPGAGSEFWFNARLDPVPRPPGKEPASDDDRTALKVLIVEPDAHMAAALSLSLQGRQMAGHGVADGQAATVALARAAADGSPFDGVLLDWEAVDGDAGLAGAGGGLVAGLRQAAGAGQPLVVLGMVAVVGRSPAAGLQGPAAPDAFLSKPVLPSALRDALLRVRQDRRSPPQDGAGPPGPPDTLPQNLPAAAEAMPLAGIRVLLVEDNLINQMVARVTLERLGACITLAGDGQEALSLLHASRPLAFDVVLMDMQMPRMDGLEATRRIRADPRTAQLPVIGMTAAAMPEDRLQCMQAGMVDYVTKPVVVEQLLDALLRWTRRRPIDPPAVAVVADALPDFDLSLVTRVMGGNRQGVQRLLRSFALQEAGTMAELKALVARNDLQQLGQRLHALRGGAATLGAVAVAQAALQVELALRQGLPLGDALAALDGAMQAALATIQAQLGP
jgi:two-component system, sensor histidine kinase and response regulator